MNLGSSERWDLRLQKNSRRITQDPHCQIARRCTTIITGKPHTEMSNTFLACFIATSQIKNIQNRGSMDSKSRHVPIPTGRQAAQNKLGSTPQIEMNAFGGEATARASWLNLAMNSIARRIRRTDELDRSGSNSDHCPLVVKALCLLKPSVC